MEPKIAILAAVKEEISGIKRDMAILERKKLDGADVWLGSWQGQPILLARTGMGRRKAGKALSDILGAYSPELILSMGYAGGLDPALKVGDLFLAEKVYGRPENADARQGPREEPIVCSIDPALREKLAAIVPPDGVLLSGGVLLTVGEPVTQPGEKARLKTEFQADAVDMETAVLAKTAEEAGAPFLSLRAISDSAEDELMDVSPILDAEGEVSKLKAGWYVLTHPGSIKTFTHLKDVAQQATNHLTTFLARFVATL